jgi:glutamate synthase (NADPH/NADH) small chain
MTLKPILSAETAAANFQELQRPLTTAQARVESSRCLNCFDAPCIHSCPSGIDVPAFIARIAEGRDIAAARLIYEANVLGASCARVCPTQVLCEGACVLKDRDQKPIEIGRLQRYATDAATLAGVNALPACAAASGRRVAIVGSGPAGLACAAELARLGHATVVFEKDASAGGLNTFGIARYKLTMEESLAEIARIEALGVTIRCNSEVGKEIDGSALLEEFDAVFVGVGLGAGHTLGVDGESLSGVMDALAFIREVHERTLAEVPVGERVVVIGGGNTAIDAATQSARLGAAVTIVYRRGESDMSAYEFEREIARIDGVRFLFDTMPLAFVGDGGRLSGVRVARTRVDGRGAIMAVPGSVIEIPCDMALKAIGQSKRNDWFLRVFPGVELHRGSPRVKDGTCATTQRGLFVGGDCSNGGREVVNAVGEGKRAAMEIHAYLGAAPAQAAIQPSRIGAARAHGAGLLASVRAHEAEVAWRSARGG